MNNKWQANNYMNYKNIKKKHKLKIFTAPIICLVAINKSHILVHVNKYIYTTSKYSQINVPK